MIRGALLTFMVALCLQPRLAADGPAQQQETLQKIERAVAKTNIFELPSFQMKANVQIESERNLVNGSYQLLWNGKDQWREEIRFPAYTEVQVGGRGTIWIQRSTDFLPLRIQDLHAALGFGSGVADPGSRTGSLVQPNFTQKDKIKKIRERNQHGERQTCIEFENELKHVSEICVNERSNTIIRGSQSSYLSYVDKDLQPVGGGKLYPRFLSLVEDGKTVATASVSEFSTPGQFPADSFAPPAGVSPQAGCMNPKAFRLIKFVSPQYPQSAVTRRLEGLVAFHAWIGIDGTPRLGKIVARASPDLDQSSLIAVRGWRYEPATCNGSPVEVETVLRVNYTLQTQ